MADIELGAYITEIENMLSAERNAEAVAHCRHILGYYPKNLAVYRLLGKGLLELGRLRDAADIMTRVLSAAPDDFVAHIGMAIVSEEDGDLDRAIAHMERAFETQSSNPTIHGELKRLYGRRDGVEPSKIHMTRGALARLYVKGGNYSRAVEELRTALDESPDRVDWQVLLAKALWKNGQRVEAVDTCQDVLEKLPHCLEADSILYEIWQSAGRDDEADLHRQRVEVLDPHLAHALKDASGVTPLPKLMIPQLDYVAPAPDEVIGVPEWVRNLGLGEVVAPSVAGDDVMDVEGDLFAAGMETSEPDEESETVPDWLRDIASSEAQAAKAMGPWHEEETREGESVAPDLLQEATGRHLDEADEPVIKFHPERRGTAWAHPSEDDDQDMPEWLAQAVEWREKQTSTPADSVEGDGSGDWLSEFADEEVELAHSAAPSADVPDWFQAAREAAVAAGEDASPDRQPIESPGPEGDQELLDREAADQPAVELAEPSDLAETPTPLPAPADTGPPDWLLAIQAEQAAGQEAELSAGEDTLVESPDWLRTHQTVEGQQEEQVSHENGAKDLEAVEPSPDKVIPWLEEVKLAHETAVDESSLGGEEEAVTIPADEIPDWLRDAAPKPQPAVPKLADLPSMPVDEATSIEPTAADADELPEWLRELKETTAPPSTTPAPSPREEQIAGPVSTEIPPWLKGLLGEDEAQELSAEFSAMGTAPLTAPSESEEALAWLEQLSGQEEEAAEEPAGIEGALAPEEPELPAWLSEPYEDTAEADVAAPLAEPEPALGLDEMGEMPEAVDEAMAWLEELAARQGAVPDGQTSVDQLEPELAAEAELAPGQLEPTLWSGDEPAPDWLQQLEPEPTAVAEEPDLSQSSRQPPAEEVAEPLVSEEPLGVEAPELPEWLRGPAATSAEEVEEVEEVELPDWLREPALQLTQEETEEPELPEWLREPPSEEAEEELGEPPGAEAVLGAEDLELPEWLHEPALASAEEEVEEADLPEWLRELPAAEVQVDEPSSAEPAAGREEPELPEWLRGPAQQLTEEDAEEPELPEWLREPLAVAKDAEVEELPVTEKARDDEEPELPRWLRHPPADEAEAEGPSVAEPFTEAEEPELPEWLSDLPTEELEAWAEEPSVVERATVIEEPERPEWLRQPVSAAAEEEVDEAELPDWLRQPAAEEAVLQVEELTAVEPSATVVEEPELPDWLREPALQLTEEETEELDLPGWLRDLPVEEVEAEEPALAESATVVEERELPERLSESASASAEEEVEEAELPEWLREPAAEGAELEMAQEPAAEPSAVEKEGEPSEWMREPPIREIPLEAQELPAAEPVSPTPKVEQLTAEESESGLESVAGEMEEPEPVMPEAKEPTTPPVSALRQQLTDTPDDHVARLALARALTADGLLDEALDKYGELVSAGHSLEGVSTDLEEIVRSSPRNARVRRTLGDAYMRQDKLSEALEAYRQALNSL